MRRKAEAAQRDPELAALYLEAFARGRTEDDDEAPLVGAYLTAEFQLWVTAFVRAWSKG